MFRAIKIYVEYHELPIYASIYLSICNLGSLFCIYETIVLNFHLNVDYTTTYDIVLLIVFQLVNQFLFYSLEI